ncbi:MAG: hypothetical protein ACYSR9_13870 [Planctomycetota bacterium]|jgi:hypothetical protein
MMKDREPAVIHPFVFAIFPVLFLYSHNIQEMLLKWTVVPAVIIMASTFVLWVVLVFLCRDENKAGLLVSLFLTYFFLYGHFVGMTRGPAGGWRGSHLWLLVVWTAVFLLMGYLALKIRQLGNVTKILNVMAICLVVFSLINIVRFEIRAAVSRGDMSIVQVEEFPSVSKVGGTCPNIYYIILDAYVGNDVLKESFDYDNSWFIEQLDKRGFFTAGQSRSNYVKTFLSLTSSMNYDYLNEFAEQIGAGSADRRPMRELLRNNRVFRFLKRYGYSIVAFPTGFQFTELKNVDVYMSGGLWSLDDFSGELIYNTPVAALVQIFTNQSFKDVLHRRRVMYSFDHLADTVEMEAPIFVFAHIACPHKPFVLDEDGRSISTSKASGEYSPEEMYVSQMKYVNKKVIEVVDNLLANSAQRPIIILQADHGVRWRLDSKQLERNTPEIYKEAFSILNSYYLPGCDYSQLYDSITPVNTFRVVLNHYFGTDMELLEDESYFSVQARLYDFVNVTEELDK